LGSSKTFTLKALLAKSLLQSTYGFLGFLPSLLQLAGIPFPQKKTVISGIGKGGFWPPFCISCCYL
jgi:hypothetical protein